MRSFIKKHIDVFKPSLNTGDCSFALPLAYENLTAGDLFSVFDRAFEWNSNRN